MKKPLLLLFTSVVVSQLSLANTPDDIDYSMYFNADIRDAEYCDLKIVDGKPDFGEHVTNPAMTCPDAFSWSLFVEVVNDKFWLNWANETENWPQKPWPLCGTNGASAKECCTPGSSNNDKNHCPVFPGNMLTANKLMAAKNLGIDKNLSASRKLVNQPFEKQVSRFIDQNPALTEAGRPRRKGGLPAVLTQDISTTPECSVAQIKSILPDDPQSIGRILRQTNNELTVRNQAFHNYLFENNLYNSNGVLDVFNANSKNQASAAPYHQGNTSANGTKPGKLQTIDLPPDAIMIKSNWVSEKLIAAMEEQYQSDIVKFGKREDFIYMPMQTVITAQGSDCAMKGLHYLMSFHISSKDVPQWVWTTFEHTTNPGRCDYTGCNDSFGHLVANPRTKELTNFIEPYQKSDGLAASSKVFAIDLQYPKGKSTDELTRLLKGSGIGTETTSQQLMPQPGNKAWNNYRLKGSQVDFSDHQGRPTLLGNSITEAGFMNNSSCIACHSRATVAPVAKVSEDKCSNPATFLGLSVFQPELSEFGYQQSNSGTPNHGWFYNSDDPRSLSHLQTDFIWGFLNAMPVCTD